MLPDAGWSRAVSEEFTDSAAAGQAAAECKGVRPSPVPLSTKEQKKEQPPKLYDLTTLQREANRLFGYTAKQTLDYAQSLYEKKLLTYPPHGQPVSDLRHGRNGFLRDPPGGKAAAL